MWHRTVARIAGGSGAGLGIARQPPTIGRWGKGKQIWGEPTKHQQSNRSLDDHQRLSNAAGPLPVRHLVAIKRLAKEFPSFSSLSDLGAVAIRDRFASQSKEERQMKCHTCKGPTPSKSTGSFRAGLTNHAGCDNTTWPLLPFFFQIAAWMSLDDPCMTDDCITVANLCPRRNESHGAVGPFTLRLVIYLVSSFRLG